jgi:C-terminal peptidase prc
MTKATRFALFLQIWQLVSERYVDEDYGGLDWQAVRHEYTEKVAGATDDEEFYDLMAEMIGLLGDDHSSFVPPRLAALAETDEERLQIPGGIGVKLIEQDGQLVMARVWPGNPAYEAGLRPGDRILAVEATPTDRFSSVEEVVLAIVGEAGTSVTLTILSPDGAERDVTLTRAVVELAPALVSGQMIEGTQVGLLMLDGFSPPTPGLVCEALRELAGGQTLEGLIVDVRGNSGGWTDAMLDTLALFINGGSTGRHVGRDEAFDLLIPTGAVMPELEGVPIVVLTGPYTESTAEVFAAGMQLHQRATLVGLPTAGDIEFVALHPLSDGSELDLTEGVYELPDGTRIEGHGLQPDRVVAGETWLTEPANDSQIQAAFDLLRSP